MKSNIEIHNRELILKELGRSGFFYAKQQNLSDDEFMSYCQNYGRIVDYRFGGTLNINAKNPLGGNQFSNRAMCLHQDGVLTESPPDLVFLLCTECDIDQGGEHLLSRTDKILEYLSEHESEVFQFLKNATVKYFSKLDNYYLEDLDTKSGVIRPAVVQHPAIEAQVLFLALDDPKDQQPNYRSFFNDVSEHESQKIMTIIDRVARMPEHMISIKFEAGDFLVVDNYLMIHGRNCFPLNSKRNIKRVQIGLCAQQ